MPSPPPPSSSSSSPPPPPLAISRDGAVARITLSRPGKRNAFDGDTVAALEASALELAGDETVRAVVLAGEGPSFCAGADIAWMRRLGEAGDEENRRSAARMASMYHTLDILEKPLVGRVHGACLGGGVGLAAVCDVVIASEDAFLAMSEVRLGILPAVIGPYVARCIGVRACRDLMLTGRRITAAEALRIGLVQHVAPPEAIDDAVAAVLADLLAGAPGAQRRIKRFLAALEGSDPHGARTREWTVDEIARARASPEGRAGLAAFLERRPPPWAADPDGDGDGDGDGGTAP